MKRGVWDSARIEQLKKLRKQNYLVKDIAKQFKTTENAVRMKIYKLAKKGEIKVKKMIYDDSFTFDNIKKELLIKGLSIWLCEGTKQSKSNLAVEVVNSDYRIISLFMRFLRSLNINEEKIKLRIKTEEKNIKSGTKFWANLLNVKSTCFKKPLIPKSNKPTRFKYGTLTIRYNSKKLLEEFNRLSEEIIFGS